MKSIKLKIVISEPIACSRWKSSLYYARKESRKGFLVDQHMGKFSEGMVFNTDQIPVSLYDASVSDVTPIGHDSETSTIDKNAHKRFGTVMPVIFAREAAEQPVKLLFILKGTEKGLSKERKLLNRNVEVFFLLPP